MYVRGPQHSITGGEIPPHFARIDAYAHNYSNRTNTSELGDLVINTSYKYSATLIIWNARDQAKTSD